MDNRDSGEKRPVYEEILRNERARLLIARWIIRDRDRLIDPDSTFGRLARAEIVSSAFSALDLDPTLPHEFTPSEKILADYINDFSRLSIEVQNGGDTSELEEKISIDMENNPEIPFEQARQVLVQMNKESVARSSALSGHRIER